MDQGRGEAGRADPACPRRARGQDLDSANAIKSSLEGLKVKLSARTGDTGRLFGAVTVADVVEAITAAGGPSVDKRKVTIVSPIKTVGSHKVEVRVHPEALATARRRGRLGLTSRTPVGGPSPARVAALRHARGRRCGVSVGDVVVRRATESLRTAMQLGLHLARLTAPGGDVAAYGPALAATARAAEEAGFRDLTVMDHFFQMEHARRPGRADARGLHHARLPRRRSTERMRSALLVTGVTYRHPGLLAKTVTTLDVLSGGRAELGIGAAWYEREHARPRRAVPADGRAVRAARGDAADLPARCGATTTARTTGRHYQLAETVCAPRAGAARRARRS